jgi:para-aminobenzoate synthetase component 1
MIIREIPWRSPYAAFAPLAERADAHLLHGGDDGRSDWSIVVAGPRRNFSLKDPSRSVSWIAELNALVAERRHDCAADFPAPFLSGLVGYVGYEALASHEPSLDLPASPYALPAAQFGVYNAAALFNREERRAYVAGRDEKVASRLEGMLGRDEMPTRALPAFSSVSSNFSRPAYEAAVADVIERIRNGDFFQANIAQTLTMETATPFSPFAVFQNIATSSDAFFSALLQYKDGAVVSNSPERFFRLDADGTIVAEPVKGTRPRGRDEAEDRGLAAALLADPKDRAENIMIADLMRNDLSRICNDHSIREEAICELLSLTRVHHLVSRVSGRLRNNVMIGDVFRALFPSGSITGAPKIEAMRVIGAIERRGRGPYCGAIGYIDDRGVADFAVAIRTMMIDGGRRCLSIPVGGGVTLRSNAASEYDETMVKAAGALAAINRTTEDLS